MDGAYPKGSVDGAGVRWELELAAWYGAWWGNGRSYP